MKKLNATLAALLLALSLTAISAPSVHASLPLHAVATISGAATPSASAAPSASVVTQAAAQVTVSNPAAPTAAAQPHAKLTWQELLLGMGIVALVLYIIGQIFPPLAPWADPIADDILDLRDAIKNIIDTVKSVAQGIVDLWNLFKPAIRKACPKCIVRLAGISD